MMKRALFLMLLAPLFNGPAIAATNLGIEVLPTMQSETDSPNRVWVGAFQIAWNDMIDYCMPDQSQFAGETLQIVNDLNVRGFSIANINEDSYYKYAGPVIIDTKSTIESTIKAKFNENSKLLDSIDFTPDPQKLLFYVMMKKTFEFATPFNKFSAGRFRDTKAEFFGIDKSSSSDLRQNVSVLFYNSRDDFAVKINSKEGEEVYLYKTPSEGNFESIYSDMLQKATAYDGNMNFGYEDFLRVPNLKFSETKSFDELVGYRVKGKDKDDKDTEFVIGQALEVISFELDNTGGKMVAEAAMGVERGALPSRMPLPEPRYFYLDDTFVMFLKEQGATKPYFALRVYDIAKFQDGYESQE